jgi:predicted dehydrogenase
MPDQIKVALLTHAGGAHLNEYFTSLAKTDEAASVVLSDIDGRCEAAARAALGSKLSAVYRSHEECLAKEKPALAMVTYEAALAPPVIAAALDAGCHVFAEKPSCVEADDFAKLVKRAEAKHLHLMLALANRTRPDILAARKLIQDGTFGKQYGIEVHIIADQTRLKDPKYHQGWQAQKERAGGGHLIWLGIHWLDLVTHLTGARIEEVAAFAGNVGGQPIDVEDAAAITMRFDNGMLGTFTSGYYLDRGYHMHIKLWGEHGWIEMSPRATPAFRWQVYNDPQQTEVQAYDGDNPPSSYAPFVREAVQAAADLREPPITGAEGLRVLQTVFACYRAAETGSVQRVS